MGDDENEHSKRQHTSSPLRKKIFFISGMKDKCDAHALIANSTIIGSTTTTILFLFYDDRNNL